MRRDWLIDKGGTAPTLLKAKRAARHFDGLVGVDHGYVYEAGERTDKVGIRFHVRQKKPLRTLLAGDRLPRNIDGIRVDVIEAGYHPHAGDPLAVDPVMQPGLNIGNVLRKSEGTLGCLVKDTGDGAVCVLSNWHVLCGGSAASQNDDISQPGGLVPARVVAKLRRWIAPKQGYDAAIAALAADVPTNNTLFDSATKIVGMAPPKLGMVVVKSGAASGVTHALVDAINGSYLVPYDEFGDTKRWMHGIRLVPAPNFHDPDLSQPGDSGSIWVELTSGLAVALHFAGEDDGGPLNEYALAHPLTDISDLLKLQVAG